MWVLTDRLERLNVQFVQPSNNPFLLSVEEEREMRQKMKDHEERLMIPRRYVHTILSLYIMN
jgi:hypothetical protein